MKQYNNSATYFKCKLCGTHVHNMIEGASVYLVSKQKVVKKIEKDEEGMVFERTTFPISKIGFRFCESCWEVSVAGMEYAIEGY